MVLHNIELSPHEVSKTAALIHALRKRDPQIVNVASLSAVRSLLETIENCDARLCSGLDMYYKAVSRMLIGSPNDFAELQAFDELMAYQLSDKFSTSTSQYWARWALLKELVSDQQHISRHIDFGYLLRQQSIRKLISCLSKSGGISTYTTLCKDLKVSRCHLGTIISKLEEASLVNCSRAGAEVEVKLTQDRLTSHHPRKCFD